MLVDWLRVFTSFVKWHHVKYGMEWNRGMELWNGMILAFGMECEMDIINLLEVNILYFL